MSSMSSSIFGNVTGGDELSPMEVIGEEQEHPDLKTYKKNQQVQVFVDGNEGIWWGATVLNGDDLSVDVRIKCRGYVCPLILPQIILWWLIYMYVLVWQRGCIIRTAWLCMQNFRIVLHLGASTEGNAFIFQKTYFSQIGIWAAEPVDRALQQADQVPGVRVSMRHAGGRTPREELGNQPPATFEGRRGIYNNICK